MKVVKRTKCVDRFNVAYRVYGEQGPVIVCINGAYQTMVVWKKFIQRFATKYRVLVFDYPGQGRSKIESLPFDVNFDEQVKILAEMVEQAKFYDDDIYLCGFSWGGVVAASYASRYPNTVKKLILGSFLARPNEKLRSIIKRGQYMADTGFHRAIPDLMISEFGQGLPHQLKKYTKRQFVEIDDRSLRAFHQYSTWIDSVRSVTDFLDLSNISADTMIVNSKDDPIVDVDDVKYAAEQIPKNNIKVVDGIGHFLHLENNELFDVYNEFFDSSKEKKYKRYCAAYIKHRK